MRRLIQIICCFLLLTQIDGASVTARAVSFYVPSWLREKPLEVTVIGFPVGTKIYLFYSTVTPEIMNEIAGHATLRVYRENPAGCPSLPREIGTVRLVASAGDHYAEAEVLSGRIREGDLVQGKGTAAYLITSVASRCRQE